MAQEGFAIYEDHLESTFALQRWIEELPRQQQTCENPDQDTENETNIDFCEKRQHISDAGQIWKASSTETRSTATRLELRELGVSTMDNDAARQGQRISPRKRSQQQTPVVEGQSGIILPTRRPSTPNTDKPRQLEDDEEMTPRSSKDIHTPHLNRHVLTRFQTPPTRSSISSTSTGSATSPRQGARSRSPVKSMADFQMAKVKVEVKDFDSPGYPIPGCVQSLVEDIQGINMGLGIIPKSVADLALAASYTDAIRRVHISLEGEEEDVEIEGDGHQDAGIRLWYSVLEIQSAARECREEQLPEPSWNAEVHSSILSLALKPKWKSQGIWYRDVTTARITDPTILPATAAAPMQSKMVDYCITFSPPRDRILETLASKNLSSINQTEAPYLRFNPIGISIETKRAAIDEENAHIQLGVWVSAQFAVLRRFIPGDAPLFPLLLVVVQGHEWRLMIAEFKERDRIVMLGSLFLGSTSSVLGTFKVVRSLRRLAGFVHKDYKEWFEAKVF